jgi:hypothetical protein
MPTTKSRSPLTLLAAPAVAATVLALIARRWRSLRLPVLSAYVLTAGAVGAYLAATTLRDRVVHEQVITAIPPRTLEAARCA